MNIKEAGHPIDEHVAHYHSLHPFNFSNLHRVELTQIGFDQLVVIELVHNNGKQWLTLTFEGVSVFRFDPGEGPSILTLCLEIGWISNRQWEHTQYQVFNTEQDLLCKFNCRSFSADVQDISPVELSEQL